MMTRRKLLTRFDGSIEFVDKRDADLPVVNGVRFVNGFDVTHRLLNVTVLERLDRIERLLGGKEKQDKTSNRREEDDIDASVSSVAGAAAGAATVVGVSG